MNNPNAMSRQRWTALMKDDRLGLSGAEIEIGYHFCHEWDGLLVGPDMPEEWECCKCHVPQLKKDLAAAFQAKRD